MRFKYFLEKLEHFLWVGGKQLSHASETSKSTKQAVFEQGR